MKTQEQIKNAPSVQLLTTLFSFQNSKSKSKQLTLKLIEQELKERKVLI
jgi:hypothetical protein